MPFQKRYSYIKYNNNPYIYYNGVQYTPSLCVSQPNYHDRTIIRTNQITGNPVEPYVREPYVRNPY